MPQELLKGKYILFMSSLFMRKIHKKKDKKSIHNLIDGNEKSKEY